MAMVGNGILKIRKKLGLTQEEFAEKLGVSRAAVSLWERNNCIPDSSSVIKMAALGDCTTDFILNPTMLPASAQGTNETA